MKRDAQKALLAATGRYIRRLFGELEPRLKALESRPAPVKGDPGERGPPGEKGDPGERGPEGPQGLSVKASEVAQAILDSPPAREMLRGELGPAGKDGRDGLDGKSVTLDEIREQLNFQVTTWALDFERRAQDVLQKAIDRIEKPKDGRDGRDGKDGRDGLGVEDFDISLDGRDLTVTVTRGEFQKSRTIRLEFPLDAGVFRDGASYEKGDGVTFGGSWWLAQCDAPKGKPGNSPDWRLCVKKGRDGRGDP